MTKGFGMTKYLILGGTGTLGQATTRRLLEDPSAEVLIFSRDELKQKEMAKSFNNPSRLSFCLGDIRDKASLLSAMADAKTVFHFAALKHVEVLEDNPEESVRTNILGTMNVAEAAIQAGVPFCVFSSTDKAVDPINVYGMCKGVSERILLRRNRTQYTTKFSVYRWGNVLGSRGSAIHLFAESLKRAGKVNLTDPRMTRFWIRIEDAVEFMLKTYETCPSKVQIPPIKSARVDEVAFAVAKGLGLSNVELNVIGMRPGEKLHEALKPHQEDPSFDSSVYPRYSSEELTDLVKDVLCR